MKPCISLASFIGLLTAMPAFAERRFPPPDFESGYTLPPLVFQEYSPGIWQWIDLSLLLAALMVMSWLLYHWRSRRGIFIVGVMSLLYFGFYKHGCICPIGAIQNVTLSLSDSSYPIAIPTLGVFVLPLLFSLFHGRVFCGGVCPLGAIQDLFLFRPVRVPPWLDGALGLLRYLYLGLAVYAVITFNRFIICEYDPFVSFFRFSGPLWKFTLGAVFLVGGLVVARPYCRYLCPYGGLLSIFSRWAARGVQISPSDCTKCTLCEAVCPFGAIRRPDTPTQSRLWLRGVVLSIVPILVIAMAYAAYSSVPGSVSGGALGLWFGIVVGAKLIAVTFKGHPTVFETDNAACLSCGRCYKWCPHERIRLRKEGQGNA